jgi:hypothetical protein
MIRNLLERITDHLPMREIKDGDTPYLERFYVGTIFGTRFYLHQFVASDPDRGLHSHPWPWAASIILAGWYLEQRRSGTYARCWLNFVVGNTFHRVILPPQADGSTRPDWTLFFHRAKRTKAWGFLRPAPRGAGLIYTPHVPNVAEDWWTTAPTGRELRAARENVQ